MSLVRRHSTPPPWLYPPPAEGWSPFDGPADEAMLDRLQRAAFDYFVPHTDPHNGLVSDSSRDGSPSSIAAVGFALSVYPIGVERGWIERADAVGHVLDALRFFAGSDQSGGADSTGYRGFYFHFLDMRSGKRTWQCELSMIDTALLVAGFLVAASYFSGDGVDETELRGTADALYRRVEWKWAEGRGSELVLGWKPGHGFMSYGWQGYNEALLLYVLGLGSPTHPIDEDTFAAWTMTYQWENVYGYDVLQAGPLFIHQLSHTWLDLRGLQDAFMREKHSDYFENSRRATYVQREYATRNPLGFEGYGEACWGLSAGEGPSGAPMSIDGRRQPFFGYAARGVPYGPDDGTLSVPSVLASVVFAPEIVLPMVRRLAAGGAGDRRVLASGFNATVASVDEDGWVSNGRLGFDQGLIVLMIENHRSGLPWRLMRDCEYVRTGLRRAGFGGGWLAHDRSPKR